MRFICMASTSAKDARTSMLLLVMRGDTRYVRNNMKRFGQIRPTGFVGMPCNRIDKNSNFEAQRLAEPHDVQVNRRTIMKQPMIFSGNLGGDAEVVAFKNGGRMIKFAVAVDERPVKDSAGNAVMENGYPKTEPEWFRCQIYVAPGKENGVAEVLKKGRFVAVAAYPQAEAWLNRNNEPQGGLVWNVMRIDF